MMMKIIDLGKNRSVKASIEVVNLHDENIEGMIIYVGRPSILGNPYEIGKDGSREEVIKKYRKWLWVMHKSNGNARKILDKLVDIAKKHEIKLGCWCAPRECHADVIKKYIMWRIIEEVHGMGGK